MTTPFEKKLRDAVGRIDDPAVVASLVRERLAEKVNLYKNLGVYVRDGDSVKLVIPEQLFPCMLKILYSHFFYLWTEEMKKAQNKKPLPTRKGQTQNKNRKRYDDAE